MKSITLFRRHAVLCLAVLAILVAGGCAYMQNTWSKVKGGFATAHAASQLDEKDEDELGKSVAILVTNRYPPSDDKKLVQYVNLVGYTLVSVSSKPDRKYYFGVLETEDLGAFSGPNGYVMVTRGALKAMTDEAELAGVLAHELTHVIDQHGLDSAKKAATKAGYMDAAKAVFGDKATEFVDFGVDAVVRNGYDKPQEDDADAGAVKLLIAAGYDPRSYARFLSHIAALQLAAPTTQSTGNETIKQIMSTHPGVADRFQAVTKLIADAGASANGQTLKDRYKAMVLQ